jgi:hypothetical protein
MKLSGAYKLSRYWIYNECIMKNINYYTIRTVQNPIKKSLKSEKSIPVAYIYMTTHFSSLIQALQ